MKNQVFEKGHLMDYTNGGSSDIDSGAPVVVGDMVGVAVSNIKVGESGVIKLEGVYTVTKKAAVVIGQGDKVYWNSTDGVTKTNTDKPMGFAFAAAAGADATVDVKLVQF